MTANIVLDSGGTNQLTVYTSGKIEEIYNNTLGKPITPPNSTANRASGPNNTKLINLQRILVRFNISGFIDVADKSKLIDIFKKGDILNNTGTFVMLYGNANYNVIMEKLVISENTEDSSATNTPDDNFDVQFTVIVGEDV